MKLYRYLCVIAILLFIFTSNVKADSCDSDDIKRLRVLASNVEITYEYNDDIYDSDGFMIYDTYKVFINNLTDELYVYESKTKTNFVDYAINDGMITIDRMYSGKKTFKIYSKDCNKALKTFYVTLPIFNYYSTDPNCEGKEDLNVCQKFYDTSNIEYDEFLNIIVEYENGDNVDEDKTGDKDNDKYIDFIKDDYLYFAIGLGVLFILIIVVLVLRHRKRGVLE